ncbi:MAG: hypothetical protein AAF986_02465 [Pseudomonadota bacterium]
MKFSTLLLLTLCALLLVTGCVSTLGPDIQQTLRLGFSIMLGDTLVQVPWWEISLLSLAAVGIYCRRRLGL